MVNRLVARLWAAEKNPKNPVHFRPLALEIFALTSGLRFYHRVVGTSPEDEAHLIRALGNAFNTPNYPKNRGLNILWPPRNARRSD